jgi:hypothetical protein
MSQTPEMGQTVKKRWWFQFSLLWLLCVVLTTAALGWLSWSFLRFQDSALCYVPEVDPKSQTERLAAVWREYGWPVLCRVQVLFHEAKPGEDQETRVDHFGLAVDQGLCLLAAAGSWTAIWWAVGFAGRKRRWFRFSLRTLVVAVLLAGSGMGLWWRWEPWYLDVPASSRISAQPPARVRNGGWLSSTTPDRVRCVKLNGTICGYPYDEPLFHLFRDDRALGTPLGFLDNDTILFCAKANSDGLPYRIYTRRRPERWWGVAWLPEFWLTLLFAPALAWSVWRDRRTL